MPASFLVISHTHSLIPLAYRLHLEGHDVELVVWSKSYADAWKGMMPATVKRSAGELTETDLASYVVQCERGERILVTDVERLRAPFGNAQQRYHRLRWDRPATGPLQAGGWFDGETLQAPHLLVFDLGPWTGGSGPLEVAGGCTLAVPSPEADLEFLSGLWEPVLGDLKAQDFRGLVRADLVGDKFGVLELGAVDAGWGRLSYEAFISERAGIGDSLSRGETPELVDSRASKYTTVCPVTVPPWPLWQLHLPGPSPRAPVQPIEGLTPEQTGDFYWHDLQVDAAHGSVSTAGLDGLVAVARGSGGTPETSRARCLEVATRLQLAGRQLRSDVGAQVPAAVSGLERAFGFVL